MKKLVYFAITLLVVACGSGAENSTGHDSDTSSVQLDTIVDSVVRGTYADYQTMCVEVGAVTMSLDDIFKTFEETHINFSQEQKDSAFFDYLLVMERIVASHEWEYDQIEEVDLKEEFFPYGFTLASGEGFYWLIADMSVAGDRFESYISSDLYAYSRLGRYTGIQTSADAGMIYTFKEWGDLLVGIEDEILKNKDSQYLPDIISIYRSYLWTYMWGLDNTPIYSWENEPGLNEEVELAYAAMQADTKHKTGKIITEHLKRLKAANYEVSWDDQWVPDQKEIKKYLEIK